MKTRCGKVYCVILQSRAEPNLALQRTRDEAARPELLR
jgi:hypothetical protein